MNKLIVSFFILLAILFHPAQNQVVFPNYYIQGAVAINGTCCPNPNSLILQQDTKTSHYTYFLSFGNTCDPSLSLSQGDVEFIEDEENNSYLTFSNYPGEFYFNQPYYSDNLLYVNGSNCSISFTPYKINPLISVPNITGSYEGGCPSNKTCTLPLQARFPVYITQIQNQAFFNVSNSTYKFSSLEVATWNGSGFIAPLNSTNYFVVNGSSLLNYNLNGTLIYVLYKFGYKLLGSSLITMIYTYFCW